MKFDVKKQGRKRLYIRSKGEKDRDREKERFQLVPNIRGTNSVLLHKSEQLIEILRI